MKAAIKSWKSWFAERERVQERKRYAEGFAWAMIEFYLNHEHCQYLHVQTCYADYPFDKGAQAALEIIRKNEEGQCLFPTL